MSNLIPTNTNLVVTDCTAPILSGRISEIKKYANTQVEKSTNLIKLAVEKGDEAVCTVLQKAFDTIAEGVGAKNMITENQTAAIQNNFDVLTTHELARFILNASTLRYKTKFQSLKDGLTMDILLQWLDVFLDDREVNIRNQQPSKGFSVYDVQTSDPYFEFEDAVRKKHKAWLETGIKSEAELATIREAKNVYFNYQQLILLGNDSEAATKIQAIADVQNSFNRINTKSNSKYKAFNTKVKDFKINNILMGSTDTEQSYKIELLKELSEWYSEFCGIYTDDFIFEYENWSEKWYGKPINPNKQLTAVDTNTQICGLMNRHYDSFSSTEAFYNSLGVKGNNGDNKFTAVTGLLDFLKKKAIDDYRKRLESILKKDIPILDFQYVFWFVKDRIQKGVQNN